MKKNQIDTFEELGEEVKNLYLRCKQEAKDFPERKSEMEEVMCHILAGEEVERPDFNVTPNELLQALREAGLYAEFTKEPK
jgi:hypothetical protein